MWVAPFSRCPDPPRGVTEVKGPMRPSECTMARCVIPGPWLGWMVRRPDLFSATGLAHLVGGEQRLVVAQALGHLVLLAVVVQMLVADLLGLCLREIDRTARQLPAVAPRRGSEHRPRRLFDRHPAGAERHREPGCQRRNPVGGSIPPASTTLTP